MTRKIMSNLHFLTAQHLRDSHEWAYHGGSSCVRVVPRPKTTPDDPGHYDVWCDICDDRPRRARGTPIPEEPR